MSQEKQHAKFPPSAGERWTECAGSIQLSERVPPAPSSFAADEGTDGHSLLEISLTRGVDLKPGHDMSDAVIAATKFARKLQKSVDEFWVESRVDLQFIHPDFGGTADITAIKHYDRIAIWDYKHGKGHAVDTRNKHGWNLQLIAYLLGQAKKYEFDFKDGELGVIQPRARHSRGAIRSDVITMKELKGFIDFFKKAIDKALGKNPPIKEGRWCFFCPAKSICPIMTKKIQSKTKDMFND